MEHKIMVGEGVKFERIRRITGYLTGTVDRWNTAKSAELNDRKTHKCNLSSLYGGMIYDIGKENSR